MNKRTAALAVAASLLVGAWAGWIAANTLGKNVRSQDPVLRAQKYALSNYSNDFPKGKELHYFVSEVGDAWLVEVSGDFGPGGGVRFLVFRNSNRVEYAGRSQ